MPCLLADSAVPVDSSALVGGLVLLGAGLVCAALWWFTTRRYRGFAARKVRVEGKVVSVTRAGGFDGVSLVQYFDQGGTEHTVRGRSSSDTRAGATAVVFYDREDPSQAIQEMDLQFTRVFAWGAVGGVVVGIGCVFAYVLA